MREIKVRKIARAFAKHLEWALFCLFVGFLIGLIIGLLEWILETILK